MSSGAMAALFCVSLRWRSTSGAIHEIGESAAGICGAPRISGSEATRRGGSRGTKRAGRIAREPAMAPRHSARAGPPVRGRSGGERRERDEERDFGHEPRS